ncbi:MAG: tripartite tricarboxylate transporter TctB family protein [Peptococcaceae bacterium]|nr:tripartite tricarboxylate transporter TctB family protein [Peptococcaceae bacterium]
MLNSNTISSLTFLMIAAGAWYLAGDFTEMGSFFPRVIASMLAVFSLLQLAMSLMHKKKETPFAGIETGRVVSLLAGIATYVALMIFVGYIISGILFLAFFTWYFGRDYDQRIPAVRALLISAAVTAGFYIVFYHIFTVPLPEGILFGG